MSKTYSTFKDSEGHDWKLKLSYGMVEQILEETGLDLDLVVKDAKKLATIITEEPKKLVQVLYVMCEDQLEFLDEVVENRPKKFGKRFDRETLDNAADALIESIVLFYPRGSAGQILAEKMPELIRGMDQVIMKRTTSLVQSALSNMVTE